MSGESAKQNLTETGYQDRAAEIRSGEELDLSHLEPFLRSHFPDEQGPLLVKQFPRGHSNLTYFVSLGDREMVLRRPPFGSKVKSAHDMGREFRILSKLHGAYPLAPEPITFCEDESVIGANFYVMRRIEGIILRKELPPDLSMPPETLHGLHTNLVDNLARI